MQLLETSIPGCQGGADLGRHLSCYRLQPTCFFWPVPSGLFCALLLRAAVGLLGSLQASKEEWMERIYLFDFWMSFPHQAGGHQRAAPGVTHLQGAAWPVPGLHCD